MGACPPLADAQFLSHKSAVASAMQASASDGKFLSEKDTAASALQASAASDDCAEASALLRDILIESDMLQASSFAVVIPHSSAKSLAILSSCS